MANVSVESKPFIPNPASVSRKALWTGRILSGLAAAFMAMDGMMKVLELPVAVEGTVKLGFPPGVIFGLGLIQLAMLALYLIPRTAALGAVLWTGYLGGAIATHVRLGNPLFSHVLFPTYVAAFFWLGLWMRDLNLRAVLPFANRSSIKDLEETDHVHGA
jgi:DoxX-like family